MMLEQEHKLVKPQIIIKGYFYRCLNGHRTRTFTDEPYIDPPPACGLCGTPTELMFEVERKLGQVVLVEEG